MRTVFLLPLLLALASGVIAKPKAQSLGKTGGALPRSMTLTPLASADGTILGTVRLLQEAGGTRVVAAIKGLPAGEYAIHIHAVGGCIGRSGSYRESKIRLTGTRR